MKCLGITGTRRVDMEEASALSSLLRQIARQRRSSDPHAAIKAARVARILAKLVEVQADAIKPKDRNADDK